jgi:hypothetical protein
MGEYVPRVRPLSARQIEQQAMGIIAAFYPNLLKEPGQFPVLDFFDLLKDEFKLQPGVEELSDGVEGITWPDGRVIVSEPTYRGAAAGNGRDRFTVMHEAYHGIEHRGQIRNALVHTGELVLYRRKMIEAFRDPEWQANTFASAILMPEATVRLLAKGGSRLFLLAEMLDAFGVSYRAAEVRIEKLKI